MSDPIGSDLICHPGPFPIGRTKNFSLGFGKVVEIELKLQKFRGIFNFPSPPHVRTLDWHWNNAESSNQSSAFSRVQARGRGYDWKKQNSGDLGSHPKFEWFSRSQSQQSTVTFLISNCNYQIRSLLTLKPLITSISLQFDNHTSYFIILKGQT